MMSRVLAFAFLIFATVSCAVQGPDPGPPTYLLDAPLSETGRTKVLILATEHLRGLGEDFDRALLTPLIDGLERFGPDAVAVEALPPEEIARLVGEATAKPGGTAAELLAAFAGDAARYAHEAQESLGLSRAEASARADSLLAAPVEPGAPARRSLALHFLAAYDLPSALLQWAYLSDEHRGADGAMTAPIASFLSLRLTSPDEIVSIGIAVARRRGLNQLFSVDDHVDDEIGLTTGLNETLGRELQGTPAYAELVASSYIHEAQRRLPEAAMQGDLLPMYMRINSPDFLNEDVSRQWHLFFRTELPSKTDRVRVALWEARNLNIAGRIRAASAWHPGGRVLVVIGAAHKPFLDRYCAQMMDVDVVHLGDVLRPRESGRTRR